MRGMPGTKDDGHDFNEQLTAHVCDKLQLRVNPADTAFSMATATFALT